MAEDEADAERVAERHAAEDGAPWQSMATPLTSARHVYKDAIDATIWNGDGKTVREAIAECEGR